MDNETNTKDTTEKAETKRQKLSPKRKKQIFGICVTVAIIIAGVVWLNDYSERIAQQTEEKYQYAIELAFDGKYDEALEVLDTFTSMYKDLFDLKYYCRAHIAYGNGNLREAYIELHNIGISGLSDEDRAALKSFKEKVDDEYTDYVRKNYQNSTTAPTTTEPTTVPPTTKRHTSSSSNKGFSSYRLGVENYSDPEDFYYDNEDYFEDYQDAEDYYRRYH